MEIKPIKQYPLPRFALALAAAAVAGTLTACQTAGEIATDGTAPAPNAQNTAVEALIRETETTEETAGETTSEAVTEAVTEAATEPETCEATEIGLAGDVDVIETTVVQKALATPGTGPAPGYEEYLEVNREADEKAQQHEAEFIEGFRRQGIELEPSSYTESYYLTGMTEACSISISFFDSEAEFSDPAARDYFQSLFKPEHDRWFDWGCVSKFTTDASEFADARTYVEIHVDVQSCGEMTAERAAKIAAEALS